LSRADKLYAMSEQRLSFDGRVAIVTGAGGGLGRSHAMLLADRGAAVVINDVGASVEGAGDDAGRAQVVADEIRAAGGEAVANADDVATKSGGEAAVQAALNAFGRVDVLVCNAGIIRMTQFPDTTLEDFNRHLDVHVAGSFNVARAAWPHLSAQGYGRVVLTTSNGILGSPPIAAYAAAKAGVLGLMRALATAGVASGIKVNAICPWGATRMMARAGAHGTGGTTEQDRALPPEAVSPAVALLAHESCPVTGEVIFSGGGVVGRMLVSETPGFQQTGHTPEDLLDNWATVMSLAGAYQCVDAVQSNQRRREQIAGSSQS
jgi:NAD(P)-dependent dehydrogenase (short-subunit alcohol dehydrogenase family)